MRVINNVDIICIGNRATGHESLCGILKIRDIYTAEGQTYKIPCDRCGDEVKVIVRHDQGLEACIHMREIIAHGGISMIGIF